MGPGATMRGSAGAEQPPRARGCSRAAIFGRPATRFCCFGTNPPAAGADRRRGVRPSRRVLPLSDKTPSRATAGAVVAHQSPGRVSAAFGQMPSPSPGARTRGAPVSRRTLPLWDECPLRPDVAGRLCRPAQQRTKAHFGERWRIGRRGGTRALGMLAYIGSDVERQEPAGPPAAGTRDVEAERIHRWRRPVPTASMS